MKNGKRVRKNDFSHPFFRESIAFIVAAFGIYAYCRKQQKSIHNQMHISSCRKNVVNIEHRIQIFYCAKL